QGLLQIELLGRSIADISTPAKRFLICGDGCFLSGDDQHLVANEDNLTRGAVRVTAPAPDILGFALFLAFKGVS
ncbi:MAG: hypothetical protein MUO77_00860, partial [Anaerolineales bacterium]|nr:hypothetical protein [Anaerolineales bacterium]